MSTILWSLASGLARAGTLDGSVVLDALHATSQSDALASGPQPGLSATELGIQVQGEVTEGILTAGVDYLGREPLAGLFPTQSYRTFYRLEAVLAPGDGALAVGLGRFAAPAAVLLLVDGARLAWHRDALAAELFAGRRGTSSSLQGVPLTTLLPAAGAALSYTAEHGQLDLRGAVAGDTALLGAEPPFAEDVLGWNGQVRGHLRFDPVLAGASVTAAPAVSYTLSGAGTDPVFVLNAFDLFQALGWFSWRPADAVRIDTDIVRQSALLEAGTVDADPPGDNLVLVDPTFTDFRLRGALRPLDRGWLRPDVRLRLRDRSRTELRYGAGIDIDNLGVEGPILRGQLFVDDILAAGTADDLGAVDRLLWSASGGWSRGPLDVELGARFTDRALAPVSARSLGAASSEDLSPFVLEAQNVIFGRGFFFASQRWFGGGDLEISTQQPEIRALLQVGLLAETDF